MTDRPTSLERAFQLARGGQFSGLGAVMDQLKAEGFSVSQIEGRSLRRQLQVLCQTAQAGTQDAPQGDGRPSA